MGVVRCPGPPRCRRAAPPFRGRTAVCSLALCLGGAAGVVSGDVAGEEIAPFRLTDLDGYVATRYVADQSQTLRETADGGSQAQSEWRSEVFLMSHSYVYHPNFMTLDVGGGPVLQLGEVQADGSPTRFRGHLYNLTGRATFLRGKAVNGALFYEHLNPVLSVSPGQILNQQNTRYGMELAATAAAMSTPLRLDVTRSQVTGRSEESQLDERQEHLNLRLSHVVGSLGATQVQYQASRQASSSGSVALPILRAASTGQGLDVDTRLQFGRGDELVSLLSANRRRYAVGDTATAQADLNLLLDLRLRHDTNLSSLGSYRYADNDNGSQRAATQAAVAGVTWSPDSEQEISFAGHAEETRGNRFASRNMGVDGGLRCQAQLPLGALQGQYQLRHDRRDQQAQSATSQVVGERLNLSGGAPVPLGVAHVVAGSVVVSNRSRSQIYLENVDYQLSSVGKETRLQRLIGGSIQDGEEVLVDYAYDPGGTFAYTQTDQTLSLTWALSRAVSAFVRESRSSAEAVAGSPAFPLNGTRGHLRGMRADFPLQAGIALAVGGSLEREQVVDPLAPYRRATEEIYLQSEEPLFAATHLGASWRRLRLTYGNVAQDINLRGYGLRLTSRQQGVDLVASRNYECDRGGMATRCRWIDALNAQWRERSLTMTARLTRSRETQDGFERRHTLAQYTLRREF